MCHVGFSHISQEIDSHLGTNDSDCELRVSSQPEFVQYVGRPQKSSRTKETAPATPSAKPLQSSSDEPQTASTDGLYLLVTTQSCFPRFRRESILWMSMPVPSCWWACLTPT
jgi:hypothetical protein